jgi:small subunit ribosomal protein S21
LRLGGASAQQLLLKTRRNWQHGKGPRARTTLEASLQIVVRDNNIDQALKALKKKLQREGLFREMKLRDHFEKPSEKRVRERAEAIRRARKLHRKKLQREGLLPPTPKKTPA